MKNKTLFWVLAVICVYVFFIPKNKDTETETKDWTKVPFRGGYTI